MDTHTHMQDMVWNTYETEMMLLSCQRGTRSLFLCHIPTVVYTRTDLGSVMELRLLDSGGKNLAG